MASVHYTGWKIPNNVRDHLLKIFPPRYPDILAHHITEKFGVPKTATAPVGSSATIIGYINDEIGLEALVVSVNGSYIRSDGKIYHITWSIDRKLGYKPVDSNEVLAKMDWSKVDNINIHIIPKVF